MLKKNPISPPILMAIAALTQITWGFVPSGSQIIIKQIPVELYITLRWTISSLFFLIILGIQNKIKIKFNRQLGILAVIGIAGMGLCSLGNALGVLWGGVVIASLVCSLSAVVKTVCSVIFLNEKPNKMFWLAILVSLLGLCLLVLGKYQISTFEVAVLSALVVFGATVLDGFMYVFSKKWKEDYSLGNYLLVTQGSAALFMWILQLFYFKHINQIFHLQMSGWFSLLYVSLVAGVCCFFVYYWVLRQIDGHKLSIFDGLHMLSSTFLGITLFGEVLNPPMFLGGFLVLFGLVLANFKALNIKKLK